MSTKDEQARIRRQRIEGIRTLQDLGRHRDVDPVREEDAQLGAWPAGSIAGKMQEVDLSGMGQRNGSEVLSRAVHEESVSLRLERDRGTRIGDELEEASVYAREPVGVRSQGSRLKQSSLKSFWDNREELITTIKEHKAFQLGAQALDALVSLDDDGRITQMVGDPRAKLAIMAAKELNAGINEKPEKSKIAQMLSGEKEATEAVLDTAKDFVPAKFQPVVQQGVKVAQTAVGVASKVKDQRSQAQAGRPLSGPKPMSVAGPSKQEQGLGSARARVQAIQAETEGEPEVEAASPEAGHER